MNKLGNLDEYIENVEAPQQLDWAPPRWMFEEYEGMEEDIAADIFSAVYWRLRTNLENNPDKEINFDDLPVRARLISEALMRSAEHARSVKEGGERAFYRLIWTISKNGYFRTTSDEYDSIQEWLLDKIPSISETSGELYNINYLLSTVFPMLERIKNGWQPPDLLKIKDHWSKMKAAIPFLRELTKELVETEQKFDAEIKKIDFQVSKLERKIPRAKTPEEKQELEQEINKFVSTKKKTEKTKEKEINKVRKQFIKGFDQTFRVIQNPNIPTNGPGGVLDTLKSGKKLKKFKGGMAILNNNKVAYTIVLPDRYNNAVESMLRQLIEFQLTDPNLLVSDLGQEVLRKD